MTARQLPPAEWTRLVGTELAAFAGASVPGMEVVVVEDDGRIVGCWALIPTWHAEGLWLAEDYRHHVAAARRLWRGLMDRAKALGAKVVVTNAESTAVQALCAKRGVPVPGVPYALTVR